MQTRLRSISLLILAASLSLAACGSTNMDKNPAHDPSKRIAVLEQGRSLTADSSLAGFVFEVPDPAVNDVWIQNGGNAQHAMSNLALTSSTPSKVWSASIGSGSSGYYKLLAMPVISGGVLYAQDSKGRVGAYDLKNGDRLWYVETAPSKHGGDAAIGGGLAVANDVVYVTTGFGEVLALRTSDGAVIWRRQLGKPIRSAPTIVDGRLFVINIENETFMIDAKTSLVVWQHKGISESATLMGSSSPAVNGDTVVVAYSSGEMFGLRAQNGRVVWSEVLAVPTKIGALPAIADIRGLPVIDGGTVYSVSHSGRIAAIDERRGERRWESEVGGVNTPAVVGNALYLIDNDNQLMALSRRDGRIVWVTALQKLSDPSDRESKPVSWWGPVMANGRLWMTNSLGRLVAYAPDTGYPVYDEDMDTPFYLPPIVAGGTMYLVSDKGRLIALR